jgi:putative restriction endonuclease
MALGRLATTGSSELSWLDDSEQLGRLVTEFGLGSRTSALQGAAYPFKRLEGDGVWTLSSEIREDTPTALKAANASGRLTSVIEQALLADPSRIDVVARQIVDLQFPSTVAPDVLSAVGLDPEAGFGVATAAAFDPETRRRSATWRNAIVRAWDGACAFCGYDGMLAGAPVGLEAAHVRWFNFDGPDEPDNGLALCSLHHKLFDRGALGLTLAYRVQVSEAFRAVGEGRTVYDLHDRELRPRPGTVLPVEEHLMWHQTQVFRGEALATAG